MKSALSNFQTLPLKDAARQLLAKLGYKSEKLPDGAAPDSFNLLPTLLGQPKQMKRDTLVVMSGNGDLAIRQGQWKYLPNLALADGWQSGPKKPNQPAQPALFDLSTDQGETKNFALN